MKLLMLEVAISALYVFDASASPLLHIPLFYLTLLYLASMFEVVELVKFVGRVRRRLKTSLPQGEGTRVRDLPLGAFLESTLRAALSAAR